MPMARLPSAFSSLIWWHELVIHILLLAELYERQLKRCHFGLSIPLKPLWAAAINNKRTINWSERQNGAVLQLVEYVRSILQQVCPGLISALDVGSRNGFVRLGQICSFQLNEFLKKLKRQQFSNFLCFFRTSLHYRAKPLGMTQDTHTTPS